MVFEQSECQDTAISARNCREVDDSISLLSNRDPEVRRRSVAALGESRDCRAVEPLLFAFTRELSSCADSCMVAINIIEALEKIPDVRTLDLLLKVESQLVDYGSRACEAGLPAGSVFYIDNDRNRIGRVVPRELHYKVFEGMRRISAALDDRTQLVSERFHDYQRKVMAEEIDRMIVRFTEVQGSDDAGILEQAGESLAAQQVECPAEAAKSQPGNSEVTATFSNYNHRRIRREAEAQVIDYICNDEDMQSIIRKGQRLKASMRRAREASGRVASETIPA